MLNKRGITIKIVPVLTLCFSILGCSLNLGNKYGLDKENPTAVEIWHYYNGVQKIEFDKMVEEFNKTVGKKEGKITNNDKLTIFPIAKSTEVLMVNKTAWDMFAKETNADINKFCTWEGIAELAKQYYEWSDSKTEIKDDGKAFF
ncbi:hypothetical protein [Clostridium saccharoperbutylacetonicum]|uniref:hypothetical protein n=1 Tax=Clostridium saccharoperbutylacetonicum TaxID=36745 RepID=UPI0039E957BD